MSTFTTIILLYELISEIIAIFIRNGKGGKLIKTFDHKTRLRYMIYFISALSIIFCIYVFFNLPQYSIDGLFIVIYSLLVGTKYTKKICLYEKGIFAFGNFIEYSNIGTVSKFNGSSFKIEKRRSVLGVLVIEKISNPDEFLRIVKNKI